MKAMLVIGGIVVLAALLGVAAWMYVLSTPQYSLYKMYQAVQERDYQTFEKYADVDDISENVVGRAMDAAEKKIQKKADGNVWEQLGSRMAQKLIVSMRPKIIDGFKSGIKKGVASGTLKLASFDAASLSVVFSKIPVKQDGDIATAAVPVNGTIVNLKMRKVDTHWQVFDIDVTADMNIFKDILDDLPTTVTF